MDVLYYWKDIDADIKAGRIGWFRSTQDNLSEFEASFPDFIWVIKTPKGKRESCNCSLVSRGRVNPPKSLPPDQATRCCATILTIRIPYGSSTAIAKTPWAAYLIGCSGTSPLRYELTCKGSTASSPCGGAMLQKLMSIAAIFFHGFVFQDQVINKSGARGAAIEG
ncbi:MAG: hypothetical protein V4684_04065 [Pseudomonadota bacterium]